MKRGFSPSGAKIPSGKKSNSMYPTVAIRALITYAKPDEQFGRKIHSISFRFNGEVNVPAHVHVSDAERKYAATNGGMKSDKTPFFGTADELGAITKVLESAGYCAVDDGACYTKRTGSISFATLECGTPAVHTMCTLWVSTEFRLSMPKPGTAGEPLTPMEVLFTSTTPSCVVTFERDATGRAFVVIDRKKGVRYTFSIYSETVIKDAPREETEINERVLVDPGVLTEYSSTVLEFGPDGNLSPAAIKRQLENAKDPNKAAFPFDGFLDTRVPLPEEVEKARRVSERAIMPLTAETMAAAGNTSNSVFMLPAKGENEQPRPILVVTGGRTYELADGSTEDVYFQFTFLPSAIYKILGTEAVPMQVWSRMFGYFHDIPYFIAGASAGIRDTQRFEESSKNNESMRQWAISVFTALPDWGVMKRCAVRVSYAFIKPLFTKRGYTAPAGALQWTSLSDMVPPPDLDLYALLPVHADGALRNVERVLLWIASVYGRVFESADELRIAYETNGPVMSSVVPDAPLFLFGFSAETN